MYSVEVCLLIYLTSTRQKVVRESGYIQVPGSYQCRLI